MITIDELQGKLKAHNNLSEVARRAMVTRSYLSALANGKKLNPTYATMENIIKALEA